MTYTNNLKSLALTSSALCLMSSLALADQVFLDDLIVDGSACIGIDCVNGESFGFDTIRMKENNLRIGADDTSTTGSFPNNDWQLTFNDSGNGGANKFSVDDITGGKTPFTIEADARSHALYVESDGDVGIGTSSPVVEMHIVGGDSPTLRLEQNGSSGFTPQTWDLAGNETNFFVRDVTGGSNLPFKVIPGADDDALVITADSNIGMGTKTANDALHIKRASGSVGIRLESGEAGSNPIRLNNKASTNEFRVTFDGPAINQMILDVNGNMTLAGTLTTSGSCSVGCDRVFAEDYALPTIEEHAEQMWENSFLPAVGPTAESGQYELTSKVLGMLNELEKAHIYIDQLNTRISELERQL